MLPPELLEAIALVATERSLSVGSDTHYDAGNIEISWWSNNVLHRLDFQPMSEGQVLVTALTDTYPFAGRFLRLLWRVVPFFPNAAKTKQWVVGKLEQPFLTGQLRTTIKEYLTYAA